MLFQSHFPRCFLTLICITLQVASTAPSTARLESVEQQPPLVDTSEAHDTSSFTSAPSTFLSPSPASPAVSPAQDCTALARPPSASTPKTPRVSSVETSIPPLEDECELYAASCTDFLNLSAHWDYSMQSWTSIHPIHPPVDPACISKENSLMYALGPL